MTSIKTFAEIAFNYQDHLSDFEDKLLEKSTNQDFDFSYLRFDGYDCSIELYEVNPGGSLSLNQQKLIIKEGFLRAYLNHSDGSETYYKFKNSQPTTGYKTK